MFLRWTLTLSVILLLPQALSLTATFSVRFWSRNGLNYVLRTKTLPNSAGPMLEENLQEWSDRRYWAYKRSGVLRIENVEAVGSERAAHRELEDMICLVDRHLFDGGDRCSIVPGKSYKE
ncbi:hypothetical protein K461DRAFT_268763 [Myriangium duriaei CBS 260.36]|uniref:Uncharacterized protein n=1 Tax=Myriangium duriaei CBS 260.36 TaxID=1168546 RepID=A0A9P4IX96_9PEZI|nr:hypothetical protein K461DRAFT_268763 [Myriangium duriaei CBS 260.36]